MFLWDIGAPSRFMSVLSAHAYQLYLSSLFRGKAPATRQDDLALPPDPISHKPKNSHSDVLPLLKLVTVDEHKGAD